MNRSGMAFNKGAFFALPMAALVFLWMLFNQRLPKVPNWLWLAGWFVLVLLVLSVLLLAESRRRNALRLLSRELGLEFSEKGNDTSLRAILNPRDPEAENLELGAVMREVGHPPPEVMKLLAEKLAVARSVRGLQQSELRHLGLFQNIQHPVARNVMGGRLGGGDALVFDYSYYTAGRKSFSVAQTVASFRFRGRAFPSFELSRQGVLMRILSVAGVQDLNFESHPEFSKRFRLRSDDENAVRSLFNTATLEFFESLGDSFQQTVEGAGECIVVYRLGQRLKPREIKAFVNEATAVASAFAKGRAERSHAAVAH